MNNSDQGGRDVIGGLLLAVVVTSFFLLAGYLFGVKAGSEAKRVSLSCETQDQVSDSR